MSHAYRNRRRRRKKCKLKRVNAEYFGDSVVFVIGDISLDGELIKAKGFSDGKGTIYVSLDSGGSLADIILKEIGKSAVNKTDNAYAEYLQKAQLSYAGQPQALSVRDAVTESPYAALAVAENGSDSGAQDEPAKGLTNNGSGDIIKKDINANYNINDNKNISLEDLTDMFLTTKPKMAPNPFKWLNNNKKIRIDKNNTWVYINNKGQSVRYPYGYPDFKNAGLIKQEVNIGEFKDYATDFKRADLLAPKGPRDAVNNTWHHLQDGHTLQEVDKFIHKEFTHCGGMALKNMKKGGSK